MEQSDIKSLPDRILGMQRLEALFTQNGYLICQSTGKMIYNFDEIVAIHIPLSPLNDQVMTVHSDYANEFLQRCLSAL